MTPDTTLVLGDFTFGSTEVPESIEFGGDQLLASHQLIGGRRVIDAMGRSEAPLSWSGLLRGENALDRALYLDNLRVQGLPLNLTWSQLSYKVLIRQFSARFERFYLLPYRITCEVVDNLTTPVTSPGQTPVDQAIGDDADAATSLAAAVGDTQLTGLLSTLNSAIANVSSFATAAQSQVNAVLAPLAAVQSRVAVLIASVGNTIGSVTTLGGVLPGNPVATNAAKLLNQVSSLTQCETLYRLRNVTGRMSANLGAITSSQRSVTTAGGNLFQIAQTQYGDAMEWTAIAKANGLTDPFVSGVQTLRIPAQPDENSGVLNA